jgi:SAM-dependent methyltransferase
MLLVPSQINASAWRNLYSEGKGDLRYPSDVLVRLGARLLRKDRDRRILDFGFGTGANLLHFAAQGFETYGVEISQHAVARTMERLRAAALSGELHLIEAGQRLPFADGMFDVVYAWQVLYYHSREDWKSAVGELERVTRKGGLIVAATAAPGDISQVKAEPLGNDMYRSKVPGQEGCILTIPERDALAEFFPGRPIEVGEFGFQFGGETSRHWVITYRMPAT